MDRVDVGYLRKENGKYAELIKILLSSVCVWVCACACVCVATAAHVAASVDYNGCTLLRAFCDGHATPRPHHSVSRQRVPVTPSVRVTPHLCPMYFGRKRSRLARDLSTGTCHLITSHIATGGDKEATLNQQPPPCPLCYLHYRSKQSLR